MLLGPWRPTRLVRASGGIPGPLGASLGPLGLLGPPLAPGGVLGPPGAYRGLWDLARPQIACLDLHAHVRVRIACLRCSFRPQQDEGLAAGGSEARLPEVRRLLRALLFGDTVRAAVLKHGDCFRAQHGHTGANSSGVLLPKRRLRRESGKHMGHGSASARRASRKKSRQ